jgi:XTP/dITP diphosphohydrolase
MIPTIIFATNNTHKIEEIQAAIGQTLHVITLRDAGIDIDIPEPHDTLEANAREKSSVIHGITGQNCFGEDTGLEVHALGGQPGVLSARFAGAHRSDKDNIDLLLHRLKDQPDRRARFRTVISLILEAPAGDNGFGYDPIFVPDGETQSFAQLTLTEKNKYSHRRKAADKLIAFLRQTE